MTAMPTPMTLTLWRWDATADGFAELSLEINGHEIARTVVDLASRSNGVHGWIEREWRRCC